VANLQVDHQLESILGDIGLMESAHSLLQDGQLLELGISHTLPMDMGVSAATTATSTTATAPGTSMSDVTLPMSESHHYVVERAVLLHLCREVK
jgi:hypothetical protein